ncbi:YczE/YyaS/YitT family protein [Effusibacillus dendaii]|uniref:Membrane protein n=1 Tax=Effusibacillus dendaii TaxID=2743772 RepID=A0A7I8D866_9BACL|nr:hypothetical protein [Effusibacillus dendaii]BCJ86304.1 membrane protein [Effusibacillus dendaii]
MESDTYTGAVEGARKTIILRSLDGRKKAADSQLAYRVWLTVRRLAVFLVGIWIMSYGIVCVVKAHLGAAPWDVLHLGIALHTGLSFGRVQQMAGLVILLTACLILKKWPSFGSIANMVLVGEFCDWIIRWQLVPEWQHLAARIGLFVVGIAVWGFGTGIYIESRLGAGPRDWLMLALHQTTGWAIRWVRTFLEIFAVAVGFALGGPFSAGTIVFSLSIGHSTEYGLRVAAKLCNRFVKGGETYETVH